MKDQIEKRIKKLTQELDRNYDLSPERIKHIHELITLCHYLLEIFEDF